MPVVPSHLFFSLLALSSLAPYSVYRTITPLHFVFLVWKHYFLFCHFLVVWIIFFLWRYLYLCLLSHELSPWQYMEIEFVLFNLTQWIPFNVVFYVCNSVPSQHFTAVRSCESILRSRCTSSHSIPYGLYHLYEITTQLVIPPEHFLQLLTWRKVSRK